MARRRYRPRVRPRPYRTLIRVVNSSTDTDQQTILTPRPGHRIRFIRTKLLQDAAEGRLFWELYFGNAPNIISGPSKGIDILAVPDSGTTATRVFLKGQGPRGKPNEVISGRWRGFAPLTPHKIIIEYREES
ncbi:MAG: hypothetical protein HQ475_11780 [SAR202 cluster bacterium]|nr:hypothetical protein [SAR202 cluster bacterium]